jgi:hypothetical protein
LREKSAKIAASEVTHAKYLVFQLAEVALPAGYPRPFWSGSGGCGLRVASP